MRIGGLVKTSTIDFPGKLAAVVFLAGCNYDCCFCQNQALLKEPQLLNEKEVDDFLEKRRDWLDGLVISGGEPTIQADLPDFIERQKKRGYAIKLDSNGSNPQLLEKLLEKGWLDYVAIDYKAPWGKYPAICGSEAFGVKGSIDILWKSSIAWELRTTVIPQLKLDDLLEMAQALPVLPLYAIQKYRQVAGLALQEKYDFPELTKFVEAIKVYQPNTIVRY